MLQNMKGVRHNNRLECDLAKRCALRSAPQGARREGQVLHDHTTNAYAELSQA